MITNDEYSKLLDQQFETNTNISANKIIPGTILKINDQHVTADIGYKSEGQIPKEEFINTGYVDMYKAMEIYNEVGFDGVFVDDHVPVGVNDSTWGHRGRAFANGYIQATIESVKRHAG